MTPDENISHAQPITQLRLRDIAYPTLLGLVIPGSMSVAAAGFVEAHWPGSLSGNGQILHTGLTIASLYLISFLIIRWWVIGRRRIGWASVGFRVVPARWYLIPFALLCIWWAVSYATYRAIGVWDGTMAFERDALMPVTPEFWIALVLMISVGPIAGLFEETLFWGLIHQWVRIRAAKWTAIFASSVLFAFVHFNFLFPGGLGGMVMSFEIFLMGVALAYIFEQCGSLWPGITLHAINNIGVVAYLMAT